MNKFIRTFIFLITALISTGNLLAQGTNTSLDNTMRSSGRIYVVVAVMLTILAGLVIYLVRLDRRLTRLEKD